MMVRRHLLPPGKFQTFQPFDHENRQENVDSMARIIPKSLTSSSSSNTASATNTLATIHLSNNLKCPIQRVLLHSGNLNEALASEMMPPPPPPPPLFVQPPPPIKSILSIAANNLFLPEVSEVEFYKSDIKDGSTSSGGSANHDDFEDEIETTNLGKKKAFSALKAKVFLDGYTCVQWDAMCVL